MKDAFKSFRVNIAKEGEEPKLVWRKYRDKVMRNKAKAYRRNRVVAGTSPEPRQPRMRHFRPLGRKDKITRLERLQAQLERDQQRMLDMAQQFAEEHHEHNEHCNHDH